MNKDNETLLNQVNNKSKEVNPLANKVKELEALLAQSETDLSHKKIEYDEYIVKNKLLLDKSTKDNKELTERLNTMLPQENTVTLRKENQTLNSKVQELNNRIKHMTDDNAD